MKDIWGVIVALTGLFLIWAWATGRASNVWAAVTGTAQTSGGTTSNPQTTTSTQTPAASWASLMSPESLPTNLQFAPLNFTGNSIPAPMYSAQPSLNAGQNSGGWTLENPNPNGIFASANPQFTNTPANDASFLFPNGQPQPGLNPDTAGGYNMSGIT